MEQVRVERLDHLGVIASVIKDIGLMDMIDSRLVPDAQERITPGEAVAGMILNGLGFANRPLSLTPPFFANTPLDLLFREGIDLRFNHLDTTSFSLTGEYVPDSDEHAITITHDYSKDHRPALKQAVWELMVSQDGGISFVSKSWNGNTSDTHGFQKRAEALMRAFKDTPSPRDLVADAKLYCEDNAAHLAKFGFITRIPATLKVVSQVIGQALQGAPWQSFDANTRYQSLALCHYGMAQRWLVVSSQAALERADATLKRATQREEEAITKQLFHHETVPNQINQPTASPTLRWVFQLLEGMHRVRMTVQGQVHDLIEGLNDVQIKLLRLLGNEVCRLYQISTG